MPVSESWTVVQTRPGFRAARASTATTQSGRSSRTRAETASADSTPVSPRTPAAKAETCRKPENCRGREAIRCRVMRRLRRVSGPTASAVMAALPRPTTKTEPSSGKRSRRSWPRPSTARGKKPSSRRQ